MILYRLLHLKKEMREWTSDPASKVIETGLEAINVFFLVPVLFLALVAIPASILFLTLGYKIFLVIFWVAAIPLLIWSWVSVVVHRITKRLATKVIDVTKKRLQEEIADTSIIVESSEV